MSETIKVGGVGKSPAIDKLNKLNAISSKHFATQKQEESIFGKDGQNKSKEIEKQNNIIQKYNIDFKKRDE